MEGGGRRGDGETGRRGDGEGGNETRGWRKSENWRRRRRKKVTRKGGEKEWKEQKKQQVKEADEADEKRYKIRERERERGGKKNGCWVVDGLLLGGCWVVGLSGCCCWGNKRSPEKASAPTGLSFTGKVGHPDAASKLFFFLSFSFVSFVLSSSPPPPHPSSSSSSPSFSSPSSFLPLPPSFTPFSSSVDGTGEEEEEEELIRPVGS